MMPARFVICCLLVILVACQCVQALQCVAVAPKAFRIGVEETVAIKIYEASFPLSVRVSLKNFPEKNRTFTSKVLQIENDEPHLTTISLKPNDIPEFQPYVYMVIRSVQGGFETTYAKVAIRKHSGYVFLQTDKPLYLPNQKVHIQIFALNEKLLPTKEPFTLEVKNPRQNQILLREMTSPESGIAEAHFELSPSPMYGNWSVTVHYGYQKSAMSSTYFEVREYVLPTYSVTIKVPKAITSYSKSIKGIVTARYVYGKPVQGSVILKYEIRLKDSPTIPIGIFKDNQLDGNTGAFEFTLDVQKDIKNRGIPWFPEDSDLFVQAEVVEKSSGKREKAVRSITLADSPYFMHFLGSRMDFRPGFPYEIQVQVHYANGDALDSAINITIEEARARTKSSSIRQLIKKEVVLSTNVFGRASYSLDTNREDSALSITVKTLVVGLPSDKQARDQLIVQSYQSDHEELHVLWISTPPKDTPIGQYFRTSVTLYPHDATTSLRVYYMVVSRGTILIFDEAVSMEKASVRNIQFPVSAAMVPSARLVVFTIHNGMIIADSVRLEVERKSSYNNLNDLRLTSRKSTPARPGEAGEILIHGEPGSFVGITGVDEALLALNKGQPLTANKIFSEMDSRDLGHGPGGGVNTYEVFSQAGLQVLIYPKCLEWDLIQPFPIADTEEELEVTELDEDDVLRSIRRLFPETLFFKTLQIGGTECKPYNTAGNVCRYKFPLPDSITTWQVQAVGISKTTGIAVSEPLKFTVFKRLFLQLDLPYAAVRGEQIEVPVTIFNYGGSELYVNVFMYGIEGVCMGRSDGDRSAEQKVNIASNSAKTIVFLVMPLEVKEYSLRVRASSPDGSDAVEKVLRVVPQGEEKEATYSFMLDPAEIYQHPKNSNGLTETFEDKKQKISIDLQLPRDHIPESGKCVVSIVGSPLGQAVATTLTGVTQDFIRLPTGCGEQAMVHMAPLVYTMMYLNHSQQLTPDTKNKGYDFMIKGHTHQLKFHKADGSFAMYKNRESSTWLTAFVARVFCQADGFIRVSRATSCSALNWLLKRQRDTGAFYEAHKVEDRTMVGAVADDVTLTAFVLIALHECNQCEIMDLTSAVNRAITFLENHVDAAQRPFAVAITAYALKLTESSKSDAAFDKLMRISVYDEDKNTRQWSVDGSGFNKRSRPWVYKERPDAVAVETTGYALLTTLLFNDLRNSHPIANWLNQQRSARGSFASTQDTVVALQALAEYSSKAGPPLLNMTCHVSSQGSSRPVRSIHIKEDNALQLHKIEVPTGETLEVISEGKGVASASIAVTYHIGPRTRDNCKFELNIKSSEYQEAIPREHPSMYFSPEGEIEDISSEVEVFPISEEDDESPHGDETYDVMTLEICTRFLEAKPAEMCILEIGLFTGYNPVIEDLRNLTAHTALTKVSYYELTDRAVILYLDEVSNSKRLCVKFKAIRIIRVGKVQPTTVKIYDYYNPDKTCTKFYRPDGTSPMLQAICTGEQCACVENLIADLVSN